jgi:hypothetical protein
MMAGAFARSTFGNVDRSRARSASPCMGLNFAMCCVLVWLASVFAFPCDVTRPVEDAPRSPPATTIRTYVYMYLCIVARTNFFFPTHSLLLAYDLARSWREQLSVSRPQSARMWFVVSPPLPSGRPPESDRAHQGNHKRNGNGKERKSAPGLLTPLPLEP